MAFTPFSAKNAAVRIGTAGVLTAKKWSVEFDGGDNDTTNFEGGGFSDTIGGIKSANITVNFDYDGSADMFQGALSLVPGSTLSSLSLYMVGVAAGARWNFPLFLVCPFTGDADVKASFAGSFRFKNKGIFTYPLGAF